MKYLLTFRRAPIACDMAEDFCPVKRPCTMCDEHFNSLPVMERIRFEVPRRFGLLRKFGWNAFVRGIATGEDLKRSRK